MSDDIVVSREFFSQTQLDIIKNSFLNDASNQEAAVFIELARARKLNPITGQIHFVKRNKRTENGWKKVWSAQVGIDGFRAIAERTGKYDGQDEPEFVYDDNGAVVSCKVRVYRKDWTRPAVGVAHMTEYAQKDRDGNPTSMWATKPHIMLSKCAEALALRKAFPEDISGIYSPEEMGNEQQNEKDVTPKQETVAILQNYVPRETETSQTKWTANACQPGRVGGGDRTEIEAAGGTTGTEFGQKLDGVPVTEKYQPKENEQREFNGGSDVLSRVPEKSRRHAGKSVSELDDRQLRWYAENWKSGPPEFDEAVAEELYTRERGGL